MKKGLAFLIAGIVTLLASLVLIAYYYKKSNFIFIFGLLLSILGLYDIYVLGIYEIFKSIRKKRLRKEGWDMDNIQEHITNGQFIIHKIDPNGIEGKPTVIKSIIVDKNFIFISDYP